MTVVVVPSLGGASAVARPPGPPGPPGWSPLLAVVADGDRRVLQVSSWVGGTGQPPVSGLYLGPNGFTPNIFQALDVRGLRGFPGDAATIEIGEVTTLPPGEPATVVNVGTDAAAVLDIAIPQGATGDIEGLTAAAIIAALTYTPANKAGETFTGAIGVTGAAGTDRGASFRTGAALRWTIGANSQAEAGADTGSDFYLSRFDDAGAPIDAPFQVTRATGVAAFAKLPTLALDGPPLGYRGLPANDQPNDYTLTASDLGGMVRHNHATGHAYTIPPASSVPWVVGDAIVVVNLDAGGAVALTEGAGVTLVQAGTTTTGNRMLAVNGQATLTYVDADRWSVVGAGVT